MKHLNCSQESQREGRILQPPNYIQHHTFQPPQHNKYIPTSNYYFSNRVDNANNIEVVGNPKPPTHAQKEPSQQVQNLHNFTPIKQNVYQSNDIIPSQREVSETDLVLLSAIEKLTYRVDFLEQRLRKAEQLILFLADGGDPNRQPGEFDKTMAVFFIKVAMY